ncbi:protein of unknown function (plasmid) [Cupriavidus taiwanensis]|nr:protein of unknown function [Cupriavidus taiwanensis]
MWVMPNPVYNSEHGTNGLTLAHESHLGLPRLASAGGHRRGSPAILGALDCPAPGDVRALSQAPVGARRQHPLVRRR